MTHRTELFALLDQAASFTWRLVEDLDEKALCAQFDDDFSPIGWHLGHIAWQKACFLLSAAGRSQAPESRYETLWDSFVSDKTERASALPNRMELFSYVRQVHERVLNVLSESSADEHIGPLVHFIANHERQHAEIIATNRLLGKLYLPSTLGAPPAGVSSDGSDAFLRIGDTRFVMGSDDDPDGWDNERRAHPVEVRSFLIQRDPVTCGAWLDFMAAGGYSDDRLWSPEANAWRLASGVAAPLHWFRDENGDWMRDTLGGVRAVEPKAPVCHINWYEASAFARFAGARLPTEAEWECSASWNPRTESKLRWPWGDALPTPAPANLGLCQLVAGGGSYSGSAAPCGARDLSGGVWEWVADPFAPYPGFAPQAYAGYSAPWFDGRHRVARGGSFMTQPEIARNCFRNWYEPRLRQPALGLRLAKDD